MEVEYWSQHKDYLRGENTNINGLQIILHWSVVLLNLNDEFSEN